MKSLKTYNMDMDVINILRNKVNKSAHVNKCVRAYQNNRAAFDIKGLSEKELLVEIVHRMDFKDPLRLLLVERINSL